MTTFWVSLVAYFVILRGDLVASSNQNVTKISEQNVLRGLFKAADSHDLSEMCGQDLRLLQNGTLSREIWAIKALDSSATVASGFVWGNNFWLGSEIGCESLNEPITISLDSRFPRTMKPNLLSEPAPIQMGYRMVYGALESPFQVEFRTFPREGVLHLGLCVPKSCDHLEIGKLVQTYFDAGGNELCEAYESKVKIFKVKELKLRDEFWMRPTVLILGTLISINILLHIVATFNFNGKLDKFIRPFSISKNLDIIFNDEAPMFRTFNGLRFFGNLTVLMFHVCWYLYAFTDNPYVMLSYSEKALYSFVANGYFGVDIFFCMSGFLMTYKFFKNEKWIEMISQNGFFSNIKLYFKLLFERYLRLAPLSMITVCFIDIISSYISDTSKIMQAFPWDENCQKYWWRNALFIQNLFPWNEMCLDASWSTACDIQFFAFYLLVFFIYAKHKNTGLAVFCNSFVFALFSVFFVVRVFRFRYSYDVIYWTLRGFYMAPWSRVMPYILGIYGGYFLARPVHEVPKLLGKIFWIASIFGVITCFTLMTNRGWDGPHLIFLTGLGRYGSSAAFLWILGAGYIGHRSWITTILEHKIFQPFGKISFAFYCVNPLVLTLIYGTMDATLHFDPVLATVIMWGVMLLTIVVSILFTITFEIPYSRLLR